MKRPNSNVKELLKNGDASHIPVLGLLALSICAVLTNFSLPHSVGMGESAASSYEKYKEDIC